MSYPRQKSHLVYCWLPLSITDLMLLLRLVVVRAMFPRTRVAACKILWMATSLLAPRENSLQVHLHHAPFSTLMTKLIELPFGFPINNNISLSLSLTKLRHHMFFLCGVWCRGQMCVLWIQIVRKKSGLLCHVRCCLCSE